MKINLTTLGCPKNIVDSEFLLGGLKGEDVEFVQDPLDAETIILNTCGFIQGAKEESIDAILQALELKKRGNCSRVFVTGCLSQRYPESLRQELPEVDGFYGNRDLPRILRELTSELDLKREILGERLLSTPKHYAYLKISEGCENPCTFCSIPAIRGKFNSKPIELLVEEAQSLAQKGVRELIVVAQDTTMYGQDLYGKPKLVPLLDKLAGTKAFKWIRLLYTYPAHFSQDLVEFIGATRAINYVDIPVQHSSNRVLQRMARKVTRQKIEHIIQALRDRNPDITIRSTCISGFPGETDADHDDLCDFVRSIRFERLGLFAYSREEDTPAYDFGDQVPEHIVQERLAELNDLQDQIMLEANEKKVGQIVEALVDDFDEPSGCYIARTTADCPEIDSTLTLRAKNLEPGKFYAVKIIDGIDCDLIGQLSPGQQNNQ